jgi:hypothetical protein
MINEILAGNLLYSQHIDRWRYLYNSYVGGQDYRDAGYLTKYQLESDADYRARCEATPLDNHCKSVISVYNSFLFRKPPSREFNELENTYEIEEFLADADLEGRSLDNFMREVSTWSQVFGHSWIILSKPNIMASSLAEEQAMGIRPYVSLLTPLVVLDWEWTRLQCGRYQLSKLKYIEDINGDVHTLKLWTPEEIITYVVDQTSADINEIITEVNELGIIPAIIAYSERSIVRGIGTSSIDDIADLQKYIYNALSEADQSIRLDSHPSLVAPPTAQIGTGAGSVITISEDSNPGLNPYILDFNGASIDSIYTVINNTISSIEKASNIGSVRATETRTVSGIALETEFALLNAKLGTFANNLELCEEQLWKLFCEYQQLPYVIDIEYPGSFELHDVDNEINQLQVAKSAATNPQILAAIDAKILDWLQLDEDELLKISNPQLIDIEGVPEPEDYIDYQPVELIDPRSGDIIVPSSPEEELSLLRSGWIRNNIDE